MPEKLITIRTPVIREGAQNYLLLSLVSFGGSIVLTRLFLELTGYPQLGNDELHIAHVLWGGLILFIAALLPVIYANRWVYPWSAFLSGIGVGLFIDEVGKFITQTNDYFYPPAAPIVYAVFLLTVLVYLRVRKPPAWDTRTEFYAILDGMTELVDRDLDPREKEKLKRRLQQVAQKANEDDLAHLADHLAGFLASEKIRIAPERPTYLEKISTVLNGWEKRVLNRNRLRLILLVALLSVGVISLIEVITGLSSSTGLRFDLEGMIFGGISRGEIRSAVGIIWYFIHLVLQAAVALMAIASTGLIALGQEKRGVDVGILVMVLNLTIVNLLAFFVDQFSAAVSALVQLIVYLALSHYRSRYLR